MQTTARVQQLNVPFAVGFVAALAIHPPPLLHHLVEFLSLPQAPRWELLLTVMALALALDWDHLLMVMVHLPILNSYNCTDNNCTANNNNMDSNNTDKAPVSGKMQGKQLRWEKAITSRTF